jgi:dTDP-4-dehydrorhamnose reductase
MKASAVHAITTKDSPTKAVRPANSRLDLSRLPQVFGVTTPSWQQALV